MDTFTLRIVTPTKDYLTKDVQSITVNATETGQMTLYAHHADLIANLDISPLEIHFNGHRSFYAISGGVLQSRNKENTITLIVYAIESIDEIDVARAKESKIRAEKILAGSRSPKEAIEMERQIKRALNRLKVKTDCKDI